jgi:hypothetical protein
MANFSVSVSQWKCLSVNWAILICTVLVWREEDMSCTQCSTNRILNLDNLDVCVKLRNLKFELFLVRDVRICL